jgi:hypothetical protein
VIAGTTVRENLNFRVADDSEADPMVAWCT